MYDYIIYFKYRIKYNQLKLDFCFKNAWFISYDYVIDVSCTTVWEKKLNTTSGHTMLISYDFKDKLTAPILNSSIHLIAPKESHIYIYII